MLSSSCQACRFRPAHGHTSRCHQQAVCPWRCINRASSTAVASATSTKEAGSRTVIVSVDTGASIEQVPVTLDSETSSLVQVEALAFPIGLVLDEDSSGRAVVAELVQGGNAEKAGVALGDVLRATTACMMQMTYPTMNLMFGGVGRPKMTKLLFPTTGQPFAACKDAIRSNVEFDNRVTLVFERMGGSTESSGQGSGSEGANAAEDDGSLSGEDSVFDASLFDD